MRAFIGDTQFVILKSQDDFVPWIDAQGLALGDGDEDGPILIHFEPGLFVPVISPLK
jgi:hypothetical protein